MRHSIDVAIIGAGPYGLSLAAHLRARNVDFRIFGAPMGAWRDNMPEGMLLKSYPWASNLSDPEAELTVKQFSIESDIVYHDSLMPLPRERFIAYGEAFKDRLRLAVEQKQLVSLTPDASGFDAGFNDGSVVHARRVVVAVGLSAFRFVPDVADGVPPELMSHSADYGPLDSLDGKDVAIVGSGSSATDLAALLHERGVAVTLVARTRELEFAGTPRPRGLLQRAIAPMSGIGNGWTMATCAGAPQLIQMMPVDLRLRLATPRALGPLGGAFMRDRVVGKVPLCLGRTVNEINVAAGKADVRLAAADGTTQALAVDHILFATGYRADLGRLGFLAPELAGSLKRAGRGPQLSAHYESSIPGLHFIGPIAASSFGPVCRFVFGTYHPARHLAAYLPAALRRRSGTPARRQPAQTPVLQ